MPLQVDPANQDSVLRGEGELVDDDELKTSSSQPYDAFFFDGEAGTEIVITGESSDFDIALGLGLWTEEGIVPVADNNDASEGSTNARIEAALTDTGEYIILVFAVNEAGRGSYEITLAGL